MNLQLINAVRDYIIQQSNRDGVLLSDHFKTVSDFQVFVLNLTIKTLVDIGFEVNEAWEMVHGDGAWKELADNVWEQLQAA